MPDADRVSGDWINWISIRLQSKRGTEILPSLKARWDDKSTWASPVPNHGSNPYKM
jgi:hypothetical protein